MLLVLSTLLYTLSNLSPSSDTSLPSTNPSTITSCVYTPNHFLPVDPKLYCLSVSKFTSLAISALNIKLSSSLSPTLMFPPAPADKNALPSTLKLPLICTLSSNVVNPTVLNVPKITVSLS